MCSAARPFLKSGEDHPVLRSVDFGRDQRIFPQSERGPGGAGHQVAVQALPTAAGDSAAPAGLPAASFALILIALTAPVAPAWRVKPTTSRTTPSAKRTCEDPSSRIPMRPITWAGGQISAPSVPPMAAAASLSRRDPTGLTPTIRAGTVT